MRLGFCLSVMALSRVCLAQTPDPATNQKILEELKGLRTSVDRLVQLMETSQKSDLALRQIQMYENRTAALEAQQTRLSAQEQQLSKDVSSATSMLREQDSGVAQGILKFEGSLEEDPQRIALRKRIADGSRTLEEARRRREAADREIASLKDRIAALETKLDEALR